jgi:hypothetical protein
MEVIIMVDKKLNELLTELRELETRRVTLFLEISSEVQSLDKETVHLSKANFEYMQALALQVKPVGRQIDKI